ncbi:hypothetical protein JW711_04765 [Candidatus Woesearchaeota archaeon]|nr:hypothetical protein [Candidatus Woesearchaeota archaeon]
MPGKNMRLPLKKLIEDIIRGDKIDGFRGAKTIAAISAYAKKDPIFKAVLQNNASYEELVQPVLERYGTFLRRIKPTEKVDPDFDQYIEGIVGSLNGVGAAQRTLDVCEYTTVERDKMLLARANHTISVVGYIYPVSAAGLAIYLRNHGIMQIGMEYLAGAVALPIPILLTREIFHEHIFRKKLRALEEAAQDTDQYVKRTCKEIYLNLTRLRPESPGRAPC